MVKKKRQCEPGEQCDDSTESCDENVTSTCPHISKSVCLNNVKKAIKPSGFSTECSECAKRPEPVDPDYELDSTLWLCLRCGSQLCGRMRNRHALQHHETPRSDSHALCVNTSHWDIFCYCCNTEVSPTSTKKLLEVIEFVKKQASSKSANEDKLPTDMVTEQHVNVLTISDENTESGSRGSSPPLRRVRGLSNLGNTCFFNSVIQCLVQTPYLVQVLQDMACGGETFVLAGGRCRLPSPPPAPPPRDEDEEAGSEDEAPAPQETELLLPPIQGELQEWGTLTKTLASALVELQTPGKSDVFTPSALLRELVNRMPQFGGGDQQDSHELLRHLLEAVRSEDLRRYQAVVLKKLGLESREKRTEVDDVTKQKVKFYGQQASDLMLRPEQVFRGFLVSTLECQDCNHSSNRMEYFLDLSLPVTADKPQPPAIARRKGPLQEEQINCLGAPDKNKPSKYQLQKEKIMNRRMRKSKKGSGHSSNEEATDLNQSDAPLRKDLMDLLKTNEQSDADIEDNLEENPKGQEASQPRSDTAANFAAYHMESGYNSEKVNSVRASPVDLDNKEKSDASPERLDKDKDDEPGCLPCLSATAIPLDYRPLCALESPMASNPDSGVASPEATKNTISDPVNQESPITSKELGSPTSFSSEINMDISSPRQSNNSPVNQDGEEPQFLLSLSKKKEVNSKLLNLDLMNDSNGCSADNGYMKLSSINSKFDRLKLNEEIENHKKYGGNKIICLPPQGVTNMQLDNSGLGFNSPELDSPKWSKDVSPFINQSVTISPRYQGDDGEFSIQSCLNQFTTSELLTGNNKVGCETCTKRLNTGKTVNTNATKRFLIASPPAVLILHLKRFQIGPRSMFRKMSKHVNFPVILDLAPFCSEKVKNLPNVSPNQSKLLYSLYGVVEHSGSMHGGHYVAYVKVRPNISRTDKRWSFLPTGGNVSKDEGDQAKATELLVNGAVNGNDTSNDTDSSLSGYESGEGATGGHEEVEAPPGKWYYVSDSRVQDITEDRVLKAQAYLLFYERIL